MFLSSHLIDKTTAGNVKKTEGKINKRESRSRQRPTFKGKRVSNLHGFQVCTFETDNLTPIQPFQISTMASSRNSGLRQGYLVLLVLAFTTLVSAIEVNVCASFNTAQTPLSKSACFGWSNKTNHLTLR